MRQKEKLRENCWKIITMDTEPKDLLIEMDTVEDKSMEQIFIHLQMYCFFLLDLSC